ncbi:MAG: response regulator transcription factor [Muribaculaceae bacterium]|nr:response regulator transcription factor [Muribaculaceae bacterium]
MAQKHHFVITDNQDITRVGMRGYISSLFPQADISETRDKKALTEILATASATVAILDYTLSDFNTVDELLIAVKRFSDVRWILFSDELSEDFLRRISGEDNVSITLKENPESEILAALESAVAGERFVCRRISDLLCSTSSGSETEIKLTPAEIEILRMIARGKTVKEIAAERFSSTHTIVTHKKNIFRKLGVNNVYEATRYAIRAGIIEMMEYYI